MELDDLKKQLVSAGWQISASEFLSGSDWYAWLSREARQTKSNCNCNDKPPSFCIEPSSFVAGGKTHSMATFRLCAELPTGRWVDFRVYNIPLSEVIPAIESAKSALFAAWEASVASTQSKEGV